MKKNNTTKSEFLASVKDKVKAKISWKRFRHSLGVCVFAVRLADRWDADRDKAMLAAMVHDYAREMSKEDLIDAAEQFAVVLDEWEKESAALLHAKVGAALVKAELGIVDEEIISAIACHTTGAPSMSLLDKILFLADSLEPAREFPGVDKLREMAERNIDKALLMMLDKSIAYVLDKKSEYLHPDTVLARNCLLAQLRAEFFARKKREKDNEGKK